MSLNQNQNIFTICCVFIFTDVDECLDINGGCGHICVNNEGGYECVCREGYKIDHRNQHSCLRKLSKIVFTIVKDVGCSKHFKELKSEQITVLYQDQINRLDIKYSRTN